MKYSLNENDTFHTGKNVHMNACVGKNGWNDIVTYTDGYKLAVEGIYNAAKSNSGYVDCYVYPLCFTARHYLELFLKKTVTEVQKLLEEQKKVNEPDLISKLKKTHDLGKLYDILKCKVKLFDERLVENVIKLQEYIDDFAKLDPTGETFRYPFNQNDEHSLDGLSCINIDDFYKRFSEIKLIEDDCFYLLEKLKKEYKTGTYTKNCSRFVIEQIVEELPDKSTWTDDSFDTVRNSIKQKYNLSSNELSDVINIIKRHPEFAEKIGCSIKNQYITQDKFSLYEFIALNGDIECCAPEVCAEIQKLFSKDELGCLNTFLELGKDEYFYSEDFQTMFNDFRDLDITDFVRHLFYYPDAKRKWIIKGIKKCGQQFLLDN